MPGDRELMRAPKGMLDVLPPESDRWIELVTRFATRAARFGYGLLLTPIVEHYEVFQRIGETTDVVSKEMYEFVDRGGRHLALRPEGTAPVARAFVEHRPPVPWKVWYLAPNFRAERPQAGRYRQHWQVGAEVLGVDDPDVDVEMISLLAGFYRDLGLRDVTLLLNSMGDTATRSRYREVLLAHWRAHANLLGDELARAEVNPLRILDSKRPDWHQVIEQAPVLSDYMTDEAATRFTRVQDGLTALGLPFTVAPRLVRGLDYYTSILFEFQSAAFDASQNAIGGGGRYDHLVEEMGGPATPSIGFGAGIERILLACEAENVLPPPAARVEVFVVVAAETSGAVTLVDDLREHGFATDRTYGGRSLKRQMAAANASGAAWTVILGEKEATRGMVAVKDMASGEQCEVSREQLVAWLQQQQGNERQ